MDLPQAYFLLESLKKNIPDSFEVDQKWVNDFHAILDTVEKDTGNNLDAFRVPQGELHHPIVSVRRASRHGQPGEVRRSTTRTVVERARLLHKVDAVLSYFQFSGNSGDAPKQSIGFRK